MGLQLLFRGEQRAAQVRNGSFRPPILRRFDCSRRNYGARVAHRSNPLLQNVSQLFQFKFCTHSKLRASDLGHTTGTNPSAAPPSAQITTTSHGGVFHMNNNKKATTPRAKSLALVMPEVHTG